MNRELLFWIAVSLFVCAVLALFAPPAQAGPPLICWPFEIGDARTLPWRGSTWSEANPDYDLRKLPGDTLELLTPSTPIIVRMETLRRATVYAMKDRGIAGELLARLQARVREAEAQGRPDALALFDVGYLLSAYQQVRSAWLVGNPASGLDGFLMIERAIRLRGPDPEMEFAAALASAGTTHQAELDTHLARAVAGAAEGSPLAKNLVTHCHLLRRQASTLAELRNQMKSVKN